MWSRYHSHDLANRFNLHTNFVWLNLTIWFCSKLAFSVVTRKCSTQYKKSRWLTLISDKRSLENWKLLTSKLTRSQSSRSRSKIKRNAPIWCRSSSKSSKTLLTWSRSSVNALVKLSLMRLLPSWMIWLTRLSRLSTSKRRSTNASLLTKLSTRKTKRSSNQWQISTMK